MNLNIILKKSYWMKTYHTNNIDPTSQTHNVFALKLLLKPGYPYMILQVAKRAVLVLKTTECLVP